MIGAACPVRSWFPRFVRPNFRESPEGRGVLLMEIIRGLEMPKKMIYDKRNKA